MAMTFATVLPGFIFDVDQPDSDRAFLKVSSAHFDAFDHENEAVDFSAEYQAGVTRHRAKPSIGFGGNTDGSFFGWVSVAHDLHITDTFVVTVNSGPAFYIGGDTGKDLGSAGVLRSGFEVGLRLLDRMRVTASLHHMSHGKLMNPDFNPGAEMIGVNLTWALN